MNFLNDSWEDGYQAGFNAGKQLQLKSNYREEVLKTWSGISGERALLNCALGLTGEAGETADLIKKHVFHGHPLDKDKLIKELGDIRYYLEVIAHELGVEMHEIERINTEKLAKRYAQGFTPEASLNRKE